MSDTQTHPASWLTNPENIALAEEGIKIIATQYNDAVRKFQAGDYSKAGLSSDTETAKLECQSQIETLRHVFEMLCIPETYTNPL